MDQETQNPTPEVPSLSLSDLVLMFNLIRVTADRGAIRAEEMATVGTVYEKLGKFLQASGALKSAEPQPTETEE